MDEYDSINSTVSNADNAMKKALGISFSGQTIYFAEAERNDDGCMVTNYGYVATNLKFGTGIEGVEKNIRDVYMFINGMVDSHNIQAQSLNLCVNTHLAVLHPAIIQDNMSGQDIDRFLRWEFSQQIIEDISQYNINTLTLGENARTGDRQVLIGGIRKKITDNFSAVLEKAKVRLMNIDLDILCSHAAYELNYPPEADSLTFLADLKPGITGILVCLGYDAYSYYQFVTSVKTPDDRLGDILNHHIDNLIYLHNQQNTTRYTDCRVLLCNALSAQVLPYVDSRYHPECLNPFARLVKPALFAKTESGGEEGQAESAEPQKEHLTMYAESVGAAIKLLT